MSNKYNTGSCTAFHLLDSSLISPDGKVGTVYNQQLLIMLRRSRAGAYRDASNTATGKGFNRYQ